VNRLFANPKEITVKTITRILTAIAITVLGATQALAQTAPAPPDAGNALRIATGKKGKGYSKLFADIRAVCGARVALTEVETEGGLQNLTALAANQADLGFAQLDTLQDLKTSDEAIGALLAVLPLNSNLLHMIVRTEGYTFEGPKRLIYLPGKTITVVPEKLADLKGLPVAVVGSARSMGRMLDRRHALELQFVDVETDEQGLAKLKAGTVAALFSTSGWPSGPFQKLRRDSGLRLLKFDLPPQAPYQVILKNYENLEAFKHPFLAVPNLLLTRPFSAGGANGKAVAALQACIQTNLTALQEGQFEPAWAEVKNTTDTFGWARFAGAGAKR
jgi:TRAP-type uncharacterized transport system substrate-binding protein